MVDSKFEDYFDYQKFPLGNNEFGYYAAVDIANEEYKYFQFENGCFYFLTDLWKISITNQLALFDQLDAWHINYRGVEAVEIETNY